MAQDIPFYPDYLRRELPAEHAKTWCITPRLTARLRAKGYTLAITPQHNARMRAAHAAEVREAVTGRLLDIIEEGRELNATPAEIIAEILADPAIAIVTEHSQRRR